MPGRDRVIDPVTGDYVKDGNGGYVTTTTIQTKVYHQLRGELGAWWGDPNAGSELFRVIRGGITRGNIVFAKNAIKTALQRFVDQGLAKDLLAEAVGDASGRIYLESSITDIQGGQVLDVSQLASVG